MKAEVYEGLPSDAESITELEHICFADPWSGKLISDMLACDLDRVYILKDMSEGERICGYSNLRITADEGEIFRICILPEYRGQGLSKLLMHKMLDEALQEGVLRILLEVRASNETAAGLYRSFGFETIAVRKQYYRAPGEDAIIMEARL